MVLAHVGLAHVLGQAGGGGLLAREISRRLFAVAHRQRGVAVKVRGLFHNLNQLAAGNFAQDIAGAVGALHVFGEQAGVRLADLSERFAGNKVDDLIEVHALIRLAPPKDRNLHHRFDRLI
jgi:hypothetical protein